MRLLNIIIVIGAICMLPGCNNAGKRLADTGSSTDFDMRVHSFPVDYLKSLDTMKASNKQEIRSYVDILELFEKLNYTPEAWQSGIREVPRVYLTIVGDRWGTKTTTEIDVVTKKRIFFRVLAPMILRANELILKDREQLERIRSSFHANHSISEIDKKWILELSGLYKVNPGESHVSGSMLDELWGKVDIVPVSLALAQAAEESGWGTSRFAALGNAVYGQWTWDDNAITPEKQRKELGNYGIAAFGSLQESICAYMLNLNTHRAYADLRVKRAELRKKGDKITGMVLAGQLTKYSERGAEYVSTLKTLMEYNRLIPADDAFLSAAPPIYLIAATE